MRRSARFLVLTTLTLLSRFAYAEDDYDKWHACQSDADCVVVPHSVCSGQTGINRLYLEDYKKWRALHEAAKECVAATTDRTDAIAKCVDKKCVVQFTRDKK